MSNDYFLKRTKFDKLSTCIKDARRTLGNGYSVTIQRHTENGFFRWATSADEHLTQNCLPWIFLKEVEL